MSTRRKYDITSTEILEVARSTAELVVDELRARADQVLPAQLYDLQRVSQQLLVAANDVVRGASVGGGGGSVDTSGLESLMHQLRAAIVADLTAQQRSLADALDMRLAGLSQITPSQPDDDNLPARIAAAVVAALGATGPSTDITAAVADLHARLSDIAEGQAATAQGRAATLDRLDDLLIDVKVGIGESVTRQHAVLLEAIDERLNDVHLGELAQSLPGRVGTVIAEAIERSHAEQVSRLDQMGELQRATLDHLGEEQRAALEAGLDRQRAGIAEVGSAAEHLVAAQTESSGQVAALRSELIDLPEALDLLRREIASMRAEMPKDLLAVRATVTDELTATRTEIAAELRTTLIEVSTELRRTLADVSAGLEAKLTDVSAELTATRTDIAAELRGTRADVSAELTATRTTISAELTSLHNAVADDLAYLRSEIVNLRGEVASLQELTAEVATLRAQLVAELEPMALDLEAARAETSGVGAGLTSLGDDIRRDLVKALADIRRDLIESTAGATESLAHRAGELADSQHELADEVRATSAAGLNRQEAALVRIRQVEQAVSDLANTFPDQAAAAMAGVGEVIRDEVQAGLTAGNGSNPLNRMEKGIAQVTWSVGELRATTEDLLSELSRLAADLPEASAALRDAASRSEARLTDLVLRLGGGAAPPAPRLVHGGERQ